MKFKALSEARSNRLRPPFLSRVFASQIAHSWACSSGRRYACFHSIPLRIEDDAFSKVIMKYGPQQCHNQCKSYPVFHRGFSQRGRLLVSMDEDETDPRSSCTVVALRQGSHFITTFHPELTKDNRFHEYFVKHCVIPSLGLSR